MFFDKCDRLSLLRELSSLLGGFLVRVLRFSAIAILIVVAVSALLTTQPAEAAGAPAPVRLQGYDSQNLRWLQQNHPSLYNLIEALPWVSDGLSDLEKLTIDWLLYLGANDISMLQLILPMPFLQSSDSTDPLAIWGMWRLVREGASGPLKEHAAFLDGISESETTLVVAAGTVYRDPQEVGRMLDPGYATIEPSTGETGVQVSIVRTGSQAQDWTAGALSDAVEFAEQTMLLDFPVDHVVLVLNEKAVISGFAGTNYGFAIGHSPDYEQGQETFRGRQFQSGLAHEVAHYYWRGNADWIDEGLANTVEYMHGIDNGLSAGQLKTRRRDCEIHDLQTLSEEPPARGDPQFYCNYYLGTLLFDELRESIDDAEFSTRLRHLYILSLTADQTPGIASVREVFIDQTAIIEKHWSGALNAPENRPFDEGISRVSHDLVQWDRYPTYDEDGQLVSLSGTLLEDAILSSETIQQAREGGYSNFSFSLANERSHLGSILPPLDDDRVWTLENPGDTVATVYQLNERVFTVTFPFPTALSNPSDYVVKVWGFRDERRTPSIGNNVDVLGYARIRLAVSTGSALGDRYDADNNGVIDKAEVIAAINDYLDGEGTEAISKSDVIEIINLYLDS